MVAASLLSWLIVAGIAGGRGNPEVLYGMLGPLVVAAVSWIVTERTYISHPDRLMSVMLKGLAIKAVFFGVYVAAMLRLMALRPGPFVASFTGYFIALYAIEAVFLKRLIADKIRF
jgi:hypothetical protein